MIISQLQQHVDTMLANYAARTKRFVRISKKQQLSRGTPKEANLQSDGSLSALDASAKAMPQPTVIPAKALLKRAIPHLTPPPAGIATYLPLKPPSSLKCRVGDRPTLVSHRAIKDRAALIVNTTDDCSDPETYLDAPSSSASYVV